MLKEFREMQAALKAGVKAMELLFSGPYINPDDLESYKGTAKDMQDALESSKKVTNIYALRFGHRHGTDMHFFTAESYPGDWEACVALGVEWEPWDDGDETVEVIPISDMLENLPVVKVVKDAAAAKSAAEQEACSHGRFQARDTLLTTGDTDFVMRLTNEAGYVRSELPSHWKNAIPSHLRKGTERSHACLAVDRMEDLVIMKRYRVSTSDPKHYFWTRHMEQFKYAAHVTPLLAAQMLAMSIRRSGIRHLVEDGVIQLSFVTNGDYVTVRLLIEIDPNWERRLELVQSEMDRIFGPAPLLNIGG